MAVHYQAVLAKTHTAVDDVLWEQLQAAYAANDGFYMPDGSYVKFLYFYPDEESFYLDWRYYPVGESISSPWMILFYALVALGVAALIYFSLREVRTIFDISKDNPILSLAIAGVVAVLLIGVLTYSRTVKA